MSEKRTVRTALVAFTLAGLGFMAIRLVTRSATTPRPGESLWRLTYRIRLVAAEAGTRLRVRIPQFGYDCHVYRQSFSHRGLAMDVVTGRQTGSREVVLVSPIRQNGAEFLADFDVQAGARAPRPSRAPMQKLSTAERTRYLRSESRIQVTSPAVSQMVPTLASQVGTLSEFVARVVEICHARIEHDPEGPADAAAALLQGRASRFGRARAMIALCRARRIPARPVVGFLLEEQGRVQPHVWVETYIGKRWLPSDPETGFTNEVPSFYLPVHRAATRVIASTEGLQVDAVYELDRIDAQSGLAEPNADSPLRILDLQRLSAGMKTTLGILLLLPLGATITAFLRNVVGVPTFGTFTPCLLALSFVNADWRTGLAVLTVVSLIGLGGRRCLERLRLLMVSRLSAVLTLIVLCMVLSVSALDFYGLTPSARAVLLPMVILTMVIERFHITAEEDGVREALHVLAGTVVVAGCCLPVLLSETMREAALRFPEAQLLVVSVLILIGRYAGYRLSELWRFRVLARPGSPEGGS